MYVETYPGVNAFLIGASKLLVSDTSVPLKFWDV